MNSQAYYRIAGDHNCNIPVDDRFLVVNCTGVCVLPEPFSAHNPTGRKDYYLMVLSEGTLQMDVDGRMGPVYAGSAIIHPPGYPYRYRKNDRTSLVYYWAHFTGSGAAELLESCNLRPETVYEAGPAGAVTEGFGRLFEHFIGRDRCYGVAAAAQLASLCAMIGRNTGDTNNPSARRIRASLHYLHRHYAEPVPVALLAEMEHLSVSRYSALFRQCMGMSPRNFLIDLRLKMATELMTRTDLSLKQIARQVGYDDQLYFSRIFRAKKGISPRRYMAEEERNTGNRKPGGR